MGKATDSQEDSRPEEALTVEQLNYRIAEIVGTNEEPQDVRCTGEVTNVSETDVALYFTLTNGDHELSCLIWKSRYQSMDVVVVQDCMGMVLEGNVEYWAEGGKINPDLGTYTRSVKATRR